MVASFTAGRPGHQRRVLCRSGKQTRAEAEAASARPEPARDARDVPTATPGAPAKARVIARGVNVYYGDNHALKQVDIDIHKNEVVSFIGPSGCGKSTFLRCINRMNDVIDGCRVSGEITLDGRDIYSREIDVVQLRARVGMVFQKPNPFPKSIYDNIAYGPRIHGLAGSKEALDAAVESSLRRAGLWNEVKDRLKEDRKRTRLNSSHSCASRMPSSA